MHMLISAVAQVTPKGPGMLQKTQKRTIEESRFTVFVINNFNIVPFLFILTFQLPPLKRKPFK